MIQRHIIKKVIYLVVPILSLQAFAEEIKITVSTNESTVTGIGYTVEGEKNGGPGKLYIGKGPANKKYIFGYRKNLIAGQNIGCGSLILNKSSHVILVSKGTRCHPILHKT